jgi:hypothetical protein
MNPGHNVQQKPEKQVSQVGHAKWILDIGVGFEN